MAQGFKTPQVVREQDVKMVGPGHDESHYISVPIKQFYSIENVGNIGVCHMQPGEETCVFALEAHDDGTTSHHYGPRSYGRKLVTALSGGVFDLLDPVLERYSFDEFSELA